MRAHTRREEWAKAKVVSPNFFYLQSPQNVGNTPLYFSRASEVYFCYRLALLDVKLADKKRQLGECLLGKLDAILTWP